MCSFSICTSNQPEHTQQIALSDKAVRGSLLRSFFSRSSIHPRPASYPLFSRHALLIYHLNQFLPAPGPSSVPACSLGPGYLDRDALPVDRAHAPASYKVWTRPMIGPVTHHTGSIQGNSTSAGERLFLMGDSRGIYVFWVVSLRARSLLFLNEDPWESFIPLESPSLTFIISAAEDSTNQRTWLYAVNWSSRLQRNNSNLKVITRDL